MTYSRDNVMAMDGDQLRVAIANAIYPESPNVAEALAAIKDWPYSIKDAWELVDEMRTRPFPAREGFTRDLKHLLSRRVGYLVSYDDMVVWLDPIDICRAWLLAQEVKG